MCGCTLPTTLHANFGSCTGGCACLASPGSYPLYYDAANGYWSNTINFCGPMGTCIFQCQGGQWQFAIEGCSNFAQLAQSGWTCSPVNFVFDFNTTLTGCCNGTVVIQVTT